jgi:ELWxxDGT repeat protein
MENRELFALPKDKDGFYSFAFLNNIAYFEATSTATGRELWQTDGTVENTKLVADLFPGYLNSNPEGLIVLNGSLYFSATENKYGREIWKLTPKIIASNDVQLSDNQVLIFPNPCQDYLQIKAKETMEQCLVFDALGRCVYEKKCSSNQAQIATDNLCDGIYFVKIRLENKQQISRKIIVRH